MKNILYVSGTGDTSGGELSLLALLTHLDRSVYHPIVVAPFEGTFTTRLREEGIEVNVQPVDSITFNQQSAEFSLSALDALRRAVKLGSYLRQRQIALVHVNAYRVGISYSIAARRMGIPVIWHDRAFSLSTRRTRVKALLARLLAQRVITVSKAVADTYARGGRVPASVVPIPNGIDAEQYRQNAVPGWFKQKFGCEGARLVGNIGILTPWKGQALFIEAARQVTSAMPDVKFIVAGDVIPFAYKSFEDSVSYRQQLIDQVRDYGLGDKIVFTGFQEDTPSLFHALELYVHCAIRPDPLPRVILEGMASQVPVIAPAEGGIPEMIDGERTGLLYPAGDIEAMVSAILRLLGDEQERASIALAGYEHVREEFSIGKHAAGVQKLYRDLT